MIRITAIPGLRVLIGRATNRVGRRVLPITIKDKPQCGGIAGTLRYTAFADAVFTDAFVIIRRRGNYRSHGRGNYRSHGLGHYRSHGHRR